MAHILLNNQTRAIIQGITGKVGQAQTRWMLEAGTPIVAGVTPGKGGQVIEGLPVYDTVNEAVAKEGANSSVIFVPAAFALRAAFEAINAHLDLVVIITENIAIRDTLEIKYHSRLTGTRVIGPNCPGILVPGIGKLGIMPQNIFTPGSIGVVGRSATLSYEVIANLTDAGLGQTAAIGIGGDPVVCTEFSDVLRLFEEDPDTQGVVLIGEIGGTVEERAVGQIRLMHKPIVAFIAGRSAPPGRKFGHAGALVRAGIGGADQKIKLLAEAGITIAETPAEIPDLLKLRLAYREGIAGPWLSNHKSRCGTAA
jgi:succinyl-CoA synthetase alpha subunit